MSIPTQSAGDNEEEEQADLQIRPPPPQSHHPSAPPDELFNISTTVDPSYIISLIRKLLLQAVSSNCTFSGGDACGSSAQGSKVEEMQSKNEKFNPTNSECKAMDTVNEYTEIEVSEGGDDGSRHQDKREGASVEEASEESSWEEYGCILWDLAASKSHAELMVQNLVLEVLLASLMVSESTRVTEIGLGIIGNLACHEVPRKCLGSRKELVDTIVDQVFVDDTPCLCEVFRLLPLCLQGSEAANWAEALLPEHVLSRILWVAENTLNPQLLEKGVGLLLAIVESRQEAAAVLLPPLMNLGLPALLINLLAFEMSKLKDERVPERYSILDLILRTLEALSVIDDYSQEIYSNKELFQLLGDLIKLPDKMEVATSCVTAAILIANMMSDVADLASEVSQDFLFLQGLFDVLPFALHDTEARSALWSIVARLLVPVQEEEISLSSLHQYVLVLSSKSDLIEEELLDHQLDGSNVERQSLTSASVKANARTRALKKMTGILSLWAKNCVTWSSFMHDNDVSQGDVDRLLDCCHRYTSKMVSL
ncbi:hypothetical protein RJ639_034003 [Escallonia herrerae]|uniref:ARM repeat superfamily protein n=1 Tax=Escallonia herrerae TaxID=1293975 RepID=A0AA89BEC4_9ASTE|nr:hypothetical protein RJ639_034003 [Escallonia herrerae]